jgi:uncharacterized membrane protein YqaE (UPF0057 family)
VTDIAKKRYSNGYYISSSKTMNVENHKTNDHINKKSDVTAESKTEQPSEISATQNIAKPEINDEMTFGAKSEAITNEAKSDSKSKFTRKNKQVASADSKPVFAVKSSKLAVSLLQMKEKKMLDRTQHSSSSDSDEMMILLVILALLLPPLAVYLKRKSIDAMFWLSILLTLLFWFPGVIFALLVVFDII